MRKYIHVCLYCNKVEATPRDTGNGPAQPLIWQDFRLKGFPNKSFHAPRIPKYKRMSVDLMNTDKDDQYFGKTTHFDTARNQPPSGQGPLHSKSPHVDEPRNQYPVRDPLGQYTEEHKVKLQREMQDIEEDRKQRNIIDQIRNEERQEEKRKDKEMLTNYYPWGRPGGGAPRNDTRKQKFLETDIDGSPTPSYRERMEREGLRYNPEREDQERFHQQLDRQRNDQELRRQEDRLDNLQRELETLKGDQYGNHGNQGGGAPHRINSESFTERREKNKIQSPEKNDPWDPWGQGAGNPDRDEQGRVKPRPHALDKQKKKSEFSGPFVHKSTKYNDPNNVKTKENRPPVTNITRDVRISTGRYSPWGWGAGNPERDRHGNVKGKKNTLDKNKPQDAVDVNPKAKKKASQNVKTQDKNEINRHKNDSPVVSLNHENKINWTDNLESPRWGHGIGNPQRRDDGKVKPRLSMLEKKQFGSSERREATPETNLNRDTRVPLVSATPWGKGTGNPKMDSDGNILTKKSMSLDKKKPRPSIESPRRGNWTAPPTFRPENYRDNIGRSIPNADRLTQRNTEVLPLYHPFGRSGGGAPVKDTQGKIVTQLQGNLLMESTYDEKTKNRLRAREYYDFLKGQEEEQRRNKQEIEWHMKAPIGDLASIMGSKNVGKPVKDPYTGEMKNHHLGNSDVTLQKMNYQPKADTEKKKYHQDLSQLADERMRYRQLNRLKDNQEGMLHHHTMDSMWGKPGGGAPKGYNLRKFNLESQIHHPTKDQTDEYVKKKDWSQVQQEGSPFTSNDEYSPRFHPNKYVRSTVQSTHANLYEYPEQLKDKNYALSEPYATY